MRVVGVERLRELLPYPELAQAMAAVLRAKQEGLAHAPERLRVPLPGGVLLCMPAFDSDIAVVKIISVHPGNREHPVIQGEVTVIEAATGRHLGVLDGPATTARRTAAVSLLAAMRLAPAPEGTLLVVGAGAQAAAHAEAFAEGLGVTRIRIASRTAKRAENLAMSLRARGLDAEAVADPASVLPEATLVVTATTSAEPVIPDAVREDAFVAAVGAFTPAAAELPASLVRRGSLFVDTMEGAVAEAGDLIRAGVDFSGVTPLYAVLDAEVVPEGPVIFKSVGHALFDLAAAKLALWDQGKERSPDRP